MDYEGETLTDFLRRLWQARLWVIVGAFFGLCGGAALLLSLQPHYQATMIVAPAMAQDTGDSFSRFENGNDVALRSVGAEYPVPAEFVRFEQVLRGNSAAVILGKYGGMLDKFGEEHVFRFQSNAPLPDKAIADYLLNNVKIEPIGTTSSRRITYAHPDPEFAMLVLKRLHTITDETIRQKAAGETQERIVWLQKELSQTTNPDHRAALVKLLMAQERRRMLTSMDEPFTAEIVEPPFASSRPKWPYPPLVLFVAAFIGMFAGFTCFSLRRTA